MLSVTQAAFVVATASKVAATSVGSSNGSSSYCDDEVCGYFAAIIGALGYGTFGVPIKHTIDVEVHPFVLQSYKTTVVFLCCFFVLWFGEELKWIPQCGILSGLLWVAGGTGGIFAIRSAGMAIAAGTWASVMVAVNFVWGILIFHEPVRSVSGTFLSFLLLVIGLIGMTTYSAPARSNNSNDDKNIETNKEIERVTSTGSDLGCDSDNALIPRRTLATTEQSEKDNETAPYLSMNDSMRDGSKEIYDGKSKGTTTTSYGNEVFLTVGRKLGLHTRRQLGIACAVWNGLCTGSSLLPLHYAKAQGFGGMAYIISFGCGAMIANIIIWIIFFIFTYFDHHGRQEQVPIAKTTSSSPTNDSIGVTASTSTAVVSWSRFESTLRMMPPWYLKEVWKQGLTAGLFLSVGMFGSILATSSLGQGIGNSLVQSKILISGVWGICWFQEVQDRNSVAKFFVSAFISVTAILLLSFQRLSATKEG